MKNNIQKLILILFIQGIFINLSYTQTLGRWSIKDSIVNGDRKNSISFSVNSKGYMGLGELSNGNHPRDLWEYDPISESWTSKANFPGNSSEYAISFSINGKGYVGMGVDSTHMFTGIVYELWEYNPTVNGWTQKSSFPGIGAISPVSFVINNKAYVATGKSVSNNLSNEVWEYDPILDAWTRLNNFPGTLRENALGFAVNDMGFVGFGFESSMAPGTLLKDLWKYDAVLDSWTKVTSFPATERRGVSGFVLDSLAYIGTGGQLNVGTFNDFWKYNPYTDTWLEVTPFGNNPSIVKNPERIFAYSFSIDSIGYLGGGYISWTGQKCAGDFLSFNPNDVINGINTINSNENITLYPNPTSSQLIIDTKLHIKEIIINSITGEVFKISATDINVIDVSSFPFGIYFIKLITDDKIITKKFVKQ